MSRFWCFIALFLLPSPMLNAVPQGSELKDVVDAVLESLEQRQQADGSYGDLKTTAKTILSFSRSHREYGPADGPFYRAALKWVEGKVQDDGSVRAAGLSSAAASEWALRAMRASPSGGDSDCLHRAEAWIVAHPGGLTDSERRELETSAETMKKDLERLLSALQESGALPNAEVGALLWQLCPIVEELSLCASGLTVDIQGPMRGAHWSAATSRVLFEQTHWQSMVKAAPSEVLADFARILSSCARVSPPAREEKTKAPAGGSARERPADLEDDYLQAATAALEFLKTQQKDGRFLFMGEADPGITAMALAAVIRTSRNLGAALPEYVGPGLDWLKSLQDSDGSIHNGSLKVYVTSASILAFEDAARPQDQDSIARSAEYLKLTQSDEGEDYDPERDWAYGGIGYGGDLRPDLSNTQFALEAMRRSGMSEKDEAFLKAIAFLQRCQNDPEVNPREVVRGDGKRVESGTDGGGVYSPGDSKAGLTETANGRYVARSYGSMTYALLKSYIFCGLSLDDPRARAALQWIEGHYTLEYNPGFDRERSPGSEYQGLYYYYFTMAKTLDLAGIEKITTRPEQGQAARAHDWRKELASHLLGLAFREGYWSNTRNERWWEEDPVLATSYALVALDHCLFPKDRGGN